MFISELFWKARVLIKSKLLIHKLKKEYKFLYDNEPEITSLTFAGKTYNQLSKEEMVDILKENLELRIAFLSGKCSSKKDKRVFFNSGDITAIDGKLYIFKCIDGKFTKVPIAQSSDWFWPDEDVYVHYSGINTLGIPENLVEVINATEYSKTKFKTEAAYNKAVSKSAYKIRLGDVLGASEPLSFCDAFDKCVSYLGYRDDDIETMTGISARTVHRMKTERKYRPSLEYIVACCLAMGLKPNDSFMLIDLAGYSLRKGHPQDRAYQALLLECYDERSLKYCDDVLEALELATLSSYISTKKKII